MTKNTYQLLAEELSHAAMTQLHHAPEELNGFGCALDAIILALRQQNPRFNETKFRAAIELPKLF